MPEIFRAARVAPMTPGRPLLEDGAVVCDGDTSGVARAILAVGPYAELCREFSGPVRDLGDVVLAPAVFNSHTHLEMAHLAGKVTSGQGFLTWVRSLTSQPLYAPDEDRIQLELARLEARGTGFVADISTRNAPAMAALLARSGQFHASFQEAIGTNVPEDTSSLIHQLPDSACASGRGTLSAAGHALYSTSGSLMRAAKQAASARNLPFSLHLAEHADEDAILLTGKSAFLDLLRERGYLLEYDAPGKRPVPQAAALGLLDERTLAVHCVTVTDEDMDLLAQSRASVCLCPRSNEYIGVGQAPVGGLLARGVNLCLGTDGLCSVADMDVYGELAWLKSHALPELSLVDGLALITSNPAGFFGLEQHLGSLAPGRQARFSVVPPELAAMFLR